MDNVEKNAPNLEEVQLRDCEGEHVQVTGYRTVSLVVRDEDGEEAELEHSFIIANVKSCMWRCVLSLGQLYRSGRSVKQHGMDLFSKVLIKIFEFLWCINATVWLFEPMFAVL
jgi:hypothetical protein